MNETLCTIQLSQISYSYSQTAVLINLQIYMYNQYLKILYIDTKVKLMTTLIISYLKDSKPLHVEEGLRRKSLSNSLATDF